VYGLTDTGEALIGWADPSNPYLRWEVFKNGQATQLDLPGNAFFFNTPYPINNQGILAGYIFRPATGDWRGFRFDPGTGQMTLLNPLPTEPQAFGLQINNRGDVLGYSFVFGALERIGVWDINGVFHTYFVEGTPQFPTVSNFLAFNDNNLIVITLDSDLTSYLVPQPGVRLDLATLVKNLPASSYPLLYVQAVNNHGDMIGWGDSGDFLLKRVAIGETCDPAPALSPAAASAAASRVKALTAPTAPGAGKSLWPPFPANSAISTFRDFKSGAVKPGQ
jgi:hypothetical protein